MGRECERMGELISGYVDGELPPEKVREVETHLADCEACRQALAEFRHIETLYGDLEPATVSSGRWKEMARAVTGKRWKVLTAGPRRIPMEIRVTRRPWWAWVAAWGLAAAGAALVAAVVWMGLPESRPLNDLAENNRAEVVSFENPSSEYETRVRLPRDTKHLLVVDIVRATPVTEGEL